MPEEYCMVKPLAQYCMVKPLAQQYLLPSGVLSAVDNTSSLCSLLMTNEDTYHYGCTSAVHASTDTDTAVRLSSLPSTA